MVGGGILAIPTVSSAAGFAPSSALLFALWTANVGTGLLLGEVAAAAIREGEDDVSLRTLSRNALGESGSSLTSALFAGTNVLLMGAYIALGGDTMFATLFPSDDFVAPRVAYAALTAALVAFPAVMEPANNALVVVMTGALVALLAVAAPSVDVGHLLQSAPPEELGGALASAAPVLVSSLVFQNVVPVIAKGFDGDSAKIREAVVLGSAAPLFAYVAFTASSEEVRGYRKDDDALNAAWTFAPPLLLALSGRDVFLPLLSMTGGIANPFLFGLLPCLLAWRHRYDGDAEPEEILPGGRVGVSALGSGAGFLVLNAGLADAAHAVSETVAHIHL
ncbi:tryptophan/tyrosine permease [Aureococcus anophagefferens]|nr:tryptophan/tyrosine permease [Aureococcus anophagefferens]